MTGSLIDLTGKRFGRLTVEHRVENRGHHPCWQVRCDCGVVKNVAGYHLRNGVVVSCGCFRAEASSKQFVKDLTGQTFGRLRVIALLAERRQEQVIWLCECSCGNQVKVRGSKLRDGWTTSCGCYARQRNSEVHSKEVVGYTAAHRRVDRLRGRAGSHACVDCGEPARDWSYNGGDPNELIGDVGGYPCSFSLSPDFYVARCRPCHATYDTNQRKQRATS